MMHAGDYQINLGISVRLSESPPFVSSPINLVMLDEKNVATFLPVDTKIPQY